MTEKGQKTETAQKLHMVLDSLTSSTLYLVQDMKIAVQESIVCKMWIPSLWRAVIYSLRNIIASFRRPHKSCRFDSKAAI